MMTRSRKDRLTAQRVEVGLVFKEMLSLKDAEEYMVRSKVPEHVIARVLAEQPSRRSEIHSDPFAPITESARNKGLIMQKDETLAQEPSFDQVTSAKQPSP